MIRDIIMTQKGIETSSWNSRLEFGPSQISWTFQRDSCCLAHPGLFPKLIFPSLSLPFSVYLCYVDLKQNLRGSGISNKLIHYYFENTSCKVETEFGGRNVGKFLLFADSKAGMFSCLFVCVSPRSDPNLPLFSLLENKLREILMSRDRRKLWHIKWQPLPGCACTNTPSPH